MKINMGEFNYNQWDKKTDIERILYEFDIGREALVGIDLLAIAGEFMDYEEYLACIFEKDNKFYMFEASHCS